MGGGYWGLRWNRGVILQGTCQRRLQYMCNIEERGEDQRETKEYTYKN